MPARIPIDREKIAAFCRKWRIAEFALFGSVLRDDFGPQSDVDVLVSFEPGVGYGFEFAEMCDELERLLDRAVDVVTRPSIERSENWIMRRAILDTLEPLHVAR